jgi:Glycosyl transferase family 2
MRSSSTTVAADRELLGAAFAFESRSGIMRRYLYRKLGDYLALHIRPGDCVLEVKPIPISSGDRIERSFCLHAPGVSRSEVHDLGTLKGMAIDYVVLNGNIHYERDVQEFFEFLRPVLQDSTRVIITLYSNLWKPLLRLATKLGLRSKTPHQNWIAVEDLQNLLLLSNYELVRLESKLLIPVYLPFLSDLINRFVAPLPFFRAFNLLNIGVARPLNRTAKPSPGASVSVIIPARNEAGNIEAAILRVPKMGPNDELIFIEGDSTDGTWERIVEMKQKYGESHNISAERQSARGKGDAVRKGFAMARNDIVMILDADLTTPPEELPRFYDAIISDKGEFINGSRLVYPMEKQAMRWLNMLANKFFALMFSFILGQRFKDTLCGTKALTRKNYLKLAAHRDFFGDFDPFGDFELIFGAARMALRIVEVPVHYRERTYGETKIQRWRHGAILLQMLAFAARRIKFI